MWFTETAWPPALILLAAAVAFGIAWSRQGRALFAALAAICLILIPVLFVVEQMIVTPAEEVAQQVYALRDAVVRDDLEGTLAFFSPSAAERDFVAAGLSIVRIEPGLRITDVSVEMKAENTQAISHFRANGTVVGRGRLEGVVTGRHVATRWSLSWRKEAGQWKIFALERLNPVTGAPIGLMSAE